MLFCYNKVLEQTVLPDSEAAEDTPAGYLLLLTELLDDWFGQSHITLYQRGENTLRLGWQEVAFPVGEFGESFGLLAERVSRSWQTEAVGIAETGEPVCITFSETEAGLLMTEKNCSGIWQEELLGLYLDAELPDSLSAECMAQILVAAGAGRKAVALDWKYADFLKEQNLAETDPTFTFCYTELCEECVSELHCRLLGLSEGKKRTLWRLFLQKKGCPPEFEWLWDEINEELPPDWHEWVLSLYDVMEELNFRIEYGAEKFALLDGEGKRLYFSTDHRAAAERVLMKVLFPLSR